MAFATISIGSLGCATQLAKHFKRINKDEKMRSLTPEIEPGQQDQVYQVLSGLIAGVYAADRGERDASDCWTKLGYDEFKLKELEDARADVVKPSSRVRLMVFEYCRRGDGVNCKELSQRLANGDTLQMPMPKYVVAIRGTITKRGDDRLAGLHIVSETLHTQKHYLKCAESLILQMVNKFSVEDVWVAGHSLGAAIALIATRKLALKDKFLNTHLFNTPYFTIDVIAKKVLKSLAKGLGDAFVKVIPGTDSKSIRKVASPVAGQVGKGWKKFAKATGSLLAPTYSQDMAEESEQLLRTTWTPHLYVNPKDAICNEFITHFNKSIYQDTENLSTPSSTLPSALVQGITKLGSRSNHLIPAAILYINNWGDGLSESHKLHQWYKYDVVNLEVRYISERYTDSEGLASP